MPQPTSAPPASTPSSPLLRGRPGVKRVGPWSSIRAYWAADRDTSSTRPPASRRTLPPPEGAARRVGPAARLGAWWSSLGPVEQDAVKCVVAFPFAMVIGWAIAVLAFVL